MTTRIDSNGPAPLVATLPSAARTTSTPSRPFRQFVAASANVVIQGAEQAVTRLPGGSLLAASVRPAGAPPSLASQLPEGASFAPGLAPSAIGGSSAPISAGVAGQQTGGVEGVLAQGVDQNMYFLELQERISQESRTYSALSNVLKARHETLKNAIGNIR
ncbi:MAG TPA: hypothetical protein VFQ35_04435 [Polyangiaceae bacterium]|nr:hypothetical protein [Polyangiaceae bacterium]